MNKVSIIVYEESMLFQDYLIYNNICYDNLKKLDNVYYLKINYSDYDKISKLYKTRIIKYHGSKGFNKSIRYHKHMLISFFICLIMLKLLTMSIIDIKVYIEDKSIKDRIITSLYENGISKNKRKKSFDEINKIKKIILDENRDILEWIEIKERGCIYEVFVTPRVLDNNTKEDNESSSIYAANDGVIKHIVVKSGTKMVDVGDYVKKGDLLISGNILKDDNVIYSVHSSGEVFAEVWFLADAKVPLDFVEVTNTNKIVHHYYLDFLGYKFTIAGKYNDSNVESKTSLILDKPYLPFKLYREDKTIYKYNNKRLSEKEALMIGVDEATYKMGYSLKEGERLISKKVLKKEVISSKMYIEVLFKVYKNIGVSSNIDIKEKEYGSIN